MRWRTLKRGYQAFIYGIDRCLEVMNGNLEEMARSVQDELPLIRKGIELLSVRTMGITFL